ncbi:mitochondrial aldehyde dehydrogenase [Ascosphaera acerosa]|nr:mitochondrial aldehyde dehydrogenase [Ascosphaera acerosa]
MPLIASTDLFVEVTAPNGTKYIQPRGLFINNEWVKPAEEATITSINPSDESEIASVYAAGWKDVDTAVKAARKALKDPSWWDLSASDKGKLMNRLADLIEENQELLATIETMDNGKPYSVALNVDIAASVGTLRYYAGWADKIFGQTISTHSNKLAYTLRQPIGVVGQIIPWNYPILMAAWKLGPALAAGNAVVMKPAEQTPLSILVLANLIKEAGYPPGIVNILNGYGRDAGAAIASHPGIDKVAFTGSTLTGRTIMKIAAEHLKNVTLETGGKSPLIVFPDADLDQAAKWAHAGIMSNQGQVCVATSRLIVHEDVYDEFVKKFQAVVTHKSVVGNPFEDATYQGPQITKAQFDRILSYVETGKKEGAKLVQGGQPHKNANGKGFFMEPTIFIDVDPKMEIFQEEVFGPFVVIAKFKTQDEALAIANDSVYGLGAAVFTRDIARAHRVAADIESGMVWINSSNDTDYRVPFGGVKQSGIGRELGEAGLDAYTQCKAIHVNLGTTL